MDALPQLWEVRDAPLTSPMHAIDMTLVIATSKHSTVGNGGHHHCVIVLIEYFSQTCTHIVRLALVLHETCVARGQKLFIELSALMPDHRVLGLKVPELPQRQSIDAEFSLLLPKSSRHLIQKSEY